jgi:hypothetical protein
VFHQPPGQVFHFDRLTASLPAGDARKTCQSWPSLDGIGVYRADRFQTVEIGHVHERSFHEVDPAQLSLGLV